MKTKIIFSTITDQILACVVEHKKEAEKHLKKPGERWLCSQCDFFAVVVKTDTPETK